MLCKDNSSLKLYFDKSRRIKIGIISSCCVLLWIISFPAMATTFTYQAGLIDDFALPADPASPSSLLVDAVMANQIHSETTQIQMFQDFDVLAGINGGLNNSAVGHTFTDLPTNITAASLEMRVRAGNDPYVYSDKLILSFVELSINDFADPADFESCWVNSIAWEKFFSPGNNNLTGEYDSGLLQSTPWSPGDDWTFTLDLLALPSRDGSTTISLLDDLNFFGFLDVVVEDETGVDYMLLTLETVPEPATMLLFGSGLVGFLGIRKRQKRH